MAVFTNQGIHEEADAYTVSYIKITRNDQGALASLIEIGINIGKYTGEVDPISGNNTFNTFQSAVVINVSFATLYQSLLAAISSGVLTEEQTNAQIAELLTSDDYIREKAENLIETCKILGLANFPSRVERSIP